MTYSSEVLTDSPVVYWKFDETSGTTAADSSGNGRDAIYSAAPSGGASLIVDGTHSLALAESVGPYVSVADAAWMNVSSITVECWAKITNAPDAGNGDELVGRWFNSNWHLWRNTGGNLAVDLSNSAGATKTINSTTALAASTIYHLVLTKDDSNMKLYVNGSLVSDLAAGIGLGAGSSAAGSPGAGIRSVASNIQVARRLSTNGSIPAGNIDEVAIYGSALSAARILAHYEAGTAVPAIDGTLSATIPKVTASLTGSYVSPTQTGTLAAALPALTASLSGGYAPPAVGSLDATLPPLTASLSGAYQAPPVGVLSAVLPPLTASLSGTFTGSVQGSFATVLPSLAAEITGVYTPPTQTGALSATLPALTAALSGTYAATLIPGTFAAVLPILTVALSGAYDGPTPTDTSNTSNGRRRGAIATVTITRPVEAPPAGMALATKVDKAVAYPTPTMVNGRPT